MTLSTILNKEYIELPLKEPYTTEIKKALDTGKEVLLYPLNQEKNKYRIYYLLNSSHLKTHTS